MNKDLLKEVLGIPTKTGQEKAVIDWLMKWALEHRIKAHKDERGNVYMTKSRSLCEHYPLVCAHTDSVHQIRPMMIAEANGLLWAVDPEDREPIGCGGDDKCGIFICLELLMAADCLKAAFFVSEEVGCIGSRAAEPEFFKDVGYCLEFDSPQGDIVSFSCDGVQLFEENSSFAGIAVPLMEHFGAVKWQHHPYTDVAPLKRRFDFACINLPAGYYRMHTKHEYVKLADVENAIALGRALLGDLGLEKYEYVHTGERPNYNTSRKVTGLVLD